MLRKTRTQNAEPLRQTGQDPTLSPCPAGGRRTRGSAAGLGMVVGFGLALFGGAGCQNSTPMVTVDMGPTMGVLSSSVGTSPPLVNSPQDAAIWVSSADPTKSLVLATENAATTGKLYSYDLGGQNVQSSGALMQPGLVDVKSGIIIGTQTLDLAAVAESGTAQIRFFSIDRTSGMFTDITGFTNVFVDRTGGSAIPVGVALYRRPSDGAGFVVVSPSTGPMTDYLYEYQLVSAAGKINLSYKRKFGNFSSITEQGTADVRGLIVDDALGYVYYSDKAFGIRKYLADPDAPNPNMELSVFGQQAFKGDRNGLSIYAKADGTGYLLSVDQAPDQSRLLFWSREGAAGAPNTQAMIATLNLNADFVNGIEVTSLYLGSRYPKGLLVVSNRSGLNFLYYDWKDISSTLQIN